MCFFIDKPWMWLCYQLSLLCIYNFNSSQSMAIVKPALTTKQDSLSTFSVITYSTTNSAHEEVTKLSPKSGRLKSPTTT